MKKIIRLLLAIMFIFGSELPYLQEMSFVSTIDTYKENIYLLTCANSGVALPHVFRTCMEA